MTKSSSAKLAYQKAYNARPEEAAKNTLYRAAQRAAIKAGKQKIGDGIDIAHIVPLNNGGTNAPGNTKTESVKKNRGWRRGESGYKVPKEK